MEPAVSMPDPERKFALRAPFNQPTSWIKVAIRNASMPAPATAMVCPSQSAPSVVKSVKGIVAQPAPGPARHLRPVAVVVAAAVAVCAKLSIRLTPLGMKLLEQQSQNSETTMLSPRKQIATTWLPWQEALLAGPSAPRQDHGSSLSVYSGDLILQR
jgi:hypothetical protein